MGWQSVTRDIGRASSGAATVALVFILLANSRQAISACLTPTGLQRVALDYVYDGDTLVVSGGQKLRIIGINAPEVGRGGEPDEPFAREARQAVSRFLGDSETVLIRRGAEPTDKYGRWLADVYRDDSVALTGAQANVACMLLEAGLAWRATVPPNLRHQDDYRRSEARARTVSAGVWVGAVPEWPRLSPGSGFRLVRARITAVQFGQGDWQLRTGSGLMARIRTDDQHYFDADALASLAGMMVELRGWVYPWNHSGEGRGARVTHAISLRHPMSLVVTY